MYCRKSLLFIFVFFALILSYQFCTKVPEFSEDQYDERLSGGAGSVNINNSAAFGEPFEGLSNFSSHLHDAGDAFFDHTFTADPNTVRPGLGPIYNNISCSGCHRSDSRGNPSFGNQNSGMLLRLSIGNNPITGPIPVPNFGLQLQNIAIYGSVSEATVSISYQDIKGQFSDGEEYTLRKPTYIISNPYMSLPNYYYMSPRLAPNVFGLGLLDNISEETILSKADPDDLDKDGISGKPNYVWDKQYKKQMLGRFGLKANTATLLVQAADAYQQDMGITSYLNTDQPTQGQIQEPAYRTGVEIPDSVLNFVTFYLRTLAVPYRRDVKDESVIEGKQIFNQINCAKCHLPLVYTQAHPSVPQLSGQRIQPFTDLLLHDMGDELADGRDDFLATGHEWRTSPLWGIGLLKKVNVVEIYLHDGRAHSLQEAILWHGGEAEQAKQNFKNLIKQKREKLLMFLKSL